MLSKNRFKADLQSKPSDLIIKKPCLIAKQEKIKVCLLVKSALRFAAWFCDHLMRCDNFIHRHCFQDFDALVNAVPVNVSQAG